MLAPYFYGLLTAQSDFGHPAGAVLPTQTLTTHTLRTFPQNLACGARRRIFHAACVGWCGEFALASSLTSGMI
jgi:hypothetical protein